MTPGQPQPDGGRTVPRSREEQLALLARMFGTSEPATTIALQPESKDAATRAKKAYWDAFDNASDEARDAGLPTHGETALSAMHHAGHRYAEVWERRTRLLERTLRSILAGDYLSDHQRAEVVAVLCGKAPANDPKLLTDAEATLIALYRETSAADRQMLRTLLARLAAASGGER